MKYGSTLEEEAIESRAQSLEARQDLLTTELQLSDPNMQLDARWVCLSLQLSSWIRVFGKQGTAANVKNACVALEAHPEIAEARAEIEKANAEAC